MYRYLVVCLLMVAMAAGCAHGDAARTDTIQHMCPAASLSPEIDSSMPAMTPARLPEKHPVTKAVNQRIKVLRRGLSACYTRAITTRDTSGMFIGDLYIDKTGHIDRINFIRASIYKQLQVLDLDADMMNCFRDVLSSTVYPAPENTATAVRIYFLAYQMPGLKPAPAVENTLPTLRGYVMNTREAARMHPDKLPNRYQPRYFDDGHITDRTLRYSKWQNSDEYHTCFVKEYRMKRNLRGILRVRLLISPWGAVLRSEAANGSIESAFVRQCMARVFADAEFPPNPNGLYTYNYLYIDYDW